MCLSIDNLIDIGAIALASVGFFVGLAQYQRAQRWKQSEFASKEIEKLFSDEVLITACQMLDWESGTQKIPSKFLAKDGETFTYSWNDFRDAMYPGIAKPNTNGYNPDQRYCRVIFDDFFTYVDLLNHYVNLKLIRVEDIKPLQYWMTQIFNSPITKDKSLFHDYLKYYKYTGVFELNEKFQKSEQGA